MKMTRLRVCCVKAHQQSTQDPVLKGQNILKKGTLLNMISAVPEDGWLHSPLSGQEHSLGPVFSSAQLLQDSNSCNFKLAS
jgi:hypothetical protein